MASCSAPGAAARPCPCPPACLPAPRFLVPRNKLPKAVWALSVLLLAGPARAAGPARPSFLNDVMPVFTRLGCNQGACHGKGAGQNGFRLSLRGYAPELDYQWLTREYEGRRISRAVPEDSLLLRKP